MIRSICTLALSVVVCSSVFAAEPWEGPPFASDPKAALAAAEVLKPQREEDDAIVLLEETTVTFDAAGRSTRVERLIFRVLEESAVDGWGTIESSWSPWYHQRPEVDARVITREGAVHRLDPRSFQAADAVESPDIFSDTRVLRGPLPAVAPGSLVEQTITYREKNPLYAAGVTARHQFTRWAETRQSRLVLEWPTEVSLRFVNRTVPTVEPTRSEAGGVQRLVFETGPMPPFEWSEWNLPSEVSAFSYVAWSTGQSWQEVAKRYAQIVDEKIGDLGVVDKVTRAAVGDAKDTKEIAARLLAAVERDIRYAGVEFGEGSIIPRTPAETLANKYGDCKDKATLLVAMLRKAGVPAHTVLLRSGQGYDVEPDLPGLGYFDHVIVVTDGPDPIWIDPTDEFARAGELPDSDQGRLALIARPDTTTLTRTPAVESAANRAVEHRQFKLAEDGYAAIVESSEYHGSDERSFRRYYTDTARKSLGESLEQYAKDGYLAKTLAKWENANTHDLSQPFRLRLEMKEAKRGTTANGEAAVGIFMARMVNDLPAEFREAEDATSERKPRRNDYVFAKPFVFEMHYSVEPPPGYVVRTLPENEALKLGTTTLTKTYTLKPDGIILADYRFDSGTRRITAAQYEELRKEIPKLANEPAMLLYFDQVARKHLDAGEVGKAVSELRRLAALHPKEALHLSDVARALLAGGLGEAARREARRAVTLEPKSAKAYATLGTILTQDLIGREFRDGFDLEGALAAFRKARELAPDDLSIRSDLAVVLQHNADGVRYGKGAKLDDAINEWLAMKKDIESADDAAIDRDLLALYAHTGRWDDLRKLVGETTATASKGVFTLVAAGSAGADAALRASAAIEPAKRRDAQTTAAGLLATLRIYPAAAALLRDAAQGAPNAALLRTQAEMIGKAVRHEERTIDASNPRSVLDEVFLELIRSGSEEELEKFGTEEVRAVFHEKGVRTLRERQDPKRRQSRKSFSRESVPTAFIVDLAISALEVKQDGDETVGYRLRGRAAGSEEALIVYVVKEKGQYRIAADDTSPQELALRALRHAEKNEISVAKQWLDWARDHVRAGYGEDPLQSEPFASVWTRGRDAGADELRLASAILLPENKASSAIALPILISARPAATPETQTAIDQALLTAYRVMESWPELLSTAERLEQKFPASARAFEESSFALTKLNRADEARTRALARLERLRDDVAALQVLGRGSLDRRNYAEAISYYDRILALAEAKAADYNLHAWTALFAGSDLSKAIDHAQRAASLEPDNYPTLNTLAVLYAEQGKSAEARETLLKSLEHKEKDSLQAPDWYVVGRIAENYGILDAATEAYKRIEKQDVPGSTWELAQKRLAGLKR